MMCMNTFNVQFHVNWWSTWTLNVILFCFHSLAFLFAMDLASIKFPFGLMFHYTLVQCTWIARISTPAAIDMLMRSISLNSCTHLCIRLSVTAHCSLLMLSIKVNFILGSFFVFNAISFIANSKWNYETKSILQLCIEITIYDVEI